MSGRTERRGVGRFGGSMRASQFRDERGEIGERFLFTLAISTASVCEFILVLSSPLGLGLPKGEPFLP